MVSPMNVKRCGVEVASLGKYLYAIGGYDGRPLDSCERYDPQSNKWTPIASMIHRRCAV